jgi:hypothetical protein
MNPTKIRKKWCKRVQVQKVYDYTFRQEILSMTLLQLLRLYFCTYHATSVELTPRN